MLGQNRKVKIVQVIVPLFAPANNQELHLLQILKFYTNSHRGETWVALFMSLSEVVFRSSVC